MATPLYDRAMHEARKYWRERTNGLSFPAVIPLDHPRPQDGRRDLSTLERELAGEVDALLQKLTGGQPLLLYTALVLGLGICGRKYAGRADVTLLSAARSVESGVANLLPVGSVLDREASFKEALLSTRESLAGGFQHQQYPFSRMLLDLEARQRPVHLPLVVSMAGLTGEPSAGSYDLAVRFVSTQSQTKVAFRFDRRIYEEATIGRFLECLESVLRHGLGEITTPVGDLSPDPGDVAEGAEEADAPRTAVPGPGSLLGLIQAQAARQPDRVAVAQGDRITSYGALVADAGLLADQLAGLALSPGKPVGILIDGGAEMVVGMLAVLEAGVAFAPIKPLAVAGRLARTLEVLGCECILCRPEHLTDLIAEGSVAGVAHAVTLDYRAPSGGAADRRLEIMAVDLPGGTPSTDPGGGRQRHREGGGEGPRSGTAAVLLVEDGDGLTTCAVSHATLAGLIGWLNGHAGIGPEDRCFLSPGLGAGQQIYDTLGILAAGASVEIPDGSDVGSTSRLADRLLAEPITVWDLPTPLAQNLGAAFRARCAGPDAPAGPLTILLSGEKQCLALAGELRRCFPRARVLGLYAAPAVGVWSTHFPLGDELDGSPGVPVAHPIPGCMHRVVNALGETAPLHCEGRLLLDGLGPAEQAIDTGLRGVRLGGRRLTWLRGEDHGFVKYGCRVELTGIEADLCRHERVHAAEVTTVGGASEADRQVVAFLLAERDAEGDEVTPEGLRDFLVRSDVVDLVPDRFVLVDELPLTAVGAIDREVLIRRFLSTRATEDRNVEDEEVHRRLKGIWLEALRLDEVGDDESFFSNGGNSLKATLLMTRIQDEFGVDLSVQDFFRTPSLRAVARLVGGEGRQVEQPPERPGFRPVSREKYRVRRVALESPQPPEGHGPSESTTSPRGAGTLGNTPRTTP